MNTHHCCEVATGVRDNARPPVSRLRRGGELAGWIVPSATLALLGNSPSEIIDPEVNLSRFRAYRALAP